MRLKRLNYILETLLENSSVTKLCSQQLTWLNLFFHSQSLTEVRKHTQNIPELGVRGCLLLLCPADCSLLDTGLGVFLCNNVY